VDHIRLPFGRPSQYPIKDFFDLVPGHGGNIA
jgi:hypothetical protein